MWQCQDLLPPIADPLTIHRLLGCPGRGHHALTLALQLHEHLGCNRFNLRHYDVWLLSLDYRTERLWVKHVDHVAAMRDMHARGVFISIYGNDLNAHPL